ncbi:MAG: DUF2603 domain-containing protein [Wolinella sp.]
MARAKQIKPVPNIDEVIRVFQKGQKRNRALLHRLEGNGAILEFIKGKLGSKELCYVKDAQAGDEYMMVPAPLIFSLLLALNDGGKERVKLLLERDIIQQMPIDFDDVWEVAIREIEAREYAEVDTKRLVREIKRRHPNLFLQLSDLFMRKEDVLE